MNVLIINGSPRTNGIIGRMMQEARAYALAVGADCEVVELYREQVAPCRGCMRCRTEDNCVLPRDAAHVLAEKIRRVDVLVVGTPTYWGNMSGPLKTLFDRLVYVFAELPPRAFPRPKLRGSRAVVVAACSTPWPFSVLFRQSRGAVRAVCEVLKTGGMRTRSVEIPDTVGMAEIPEKYVERLHKALYKALR